MKAKPFRRLARAVVIRAVLDSILLRFPGTARRELSEWHGSDRPGRPPSLTREAFEIWQRKQAADIRRFFAEGGTELAKLAECYDMVEKARGPIDHNRIWVVLHRHKSQRHEAVDGKRRQYGARGAARRARRGGGRQSRASGD